MNKVFHSVSRLLSREQDMTTSEDEWEFVEVDGEVKKPEVTSLTSTLDFPPLLSENDQDLLDTFEIVLPKAEANKKTASTNDGDKKEEFMFGDAQDMKNPQFLTSSHFDSIPDPSQQKNGQLYEERKSGGEFEARRSRDLGTVIN